MPVKGCSYENHWIVIFIRRERRGVLDKTHHFYLVTDEQPVKLEKQVFGQQSINEGACTVVWLTM